MSEYIPKYAAGCEEDSIRTGREVYWSPKKPRRHKITFWKVFIVIGILISIYLYSTPQANIDAKFGEFKVADDRSAITGSIHIENTSKKILSKVDINLTFINENNQIIGEKDMVEKMWLSPNKSKDISYEVELIPINGKFQGKLNVKPHYLPF